MPFASANGVKLFYETAGTGYPVVFVHEFAADHRNWETQMRWFAREYQCIAFNARGYPPSDVPSNPSDYGYARAADDIAAVLDHLGLAKAHVVGLSQGAYATLVFGMRHPQRASALVVAGAGTGAWLPDREAFIAHTKENAERFLKEGSAAMAQSMGHAGTRIQLKNKDPRGWEEFVRYLSEHSAIGSSMTLRYVQAERPSLFEFKGQLAQLTIPTLLVVGDEDEPCLDVNLFLKRTIPTAGLWMIPKTGHAVNLEEPGLFNEGVQAFLSAAERGHWRMRDPRSVVGNVGFAAGEKH